MRIIIVAAFGLIVVVVLAFMFAHARKVTPSSSIQADSSSTVITNMGVVQLSEQTTQHFDIGARNGWNVTAKPLANGTIEVDMLPDEANTNRMQQTDKPRGIISVITMTAKPGRLISCQLGGVVVRFTPSLNTQ